MSILDVIVFVPFLFLFLNSLSPLIKDLPPLSVSSQFHLWLLPHNQHYNLLFVVDHVHWI